MLKPIAPSIPSRFILGPEVIAARNRINPAFPTERVRVCLVNLVARQYAGKQQPPVAAQTLATYLKATTNAQVHVVDMQQHLISLEREMLQEGKRYLTIDERFAIATQRVIDEIKQFSPHILGLSMKWGTLKPADQIVQACREPLIVVGNTISTFGSDQLLARESFKGAVAVLGEGEEALKTMVEIASENLTDCANRSLYRGIPNVKIEPGEVIGRRNIDLSIYPVLTDEGLFGEGMPWATVEASRGCAWSFCTFCSIGELSASPAWRSLPTELVLDRIERFVRAGHRWMGFADSDAVGISAITSDEDFALRVQRMEAIARGIAALNEHYENHGAIGKRDGIQLARLSVRVDSIFKRGQAKRNLRRKQLFALLKKEGGLRDVYLGVESGCQRQLNRYGKGVKVEEIVEAIRILKEELKEGEETVGIRVQPGFIFFDPQQTVAEARENIEFIMGQWLSHEGVYGSLRVQAGSRMVEILKKRRLLTGDFDLDSVSYPVQWEGETRKVREVFELFVAATRELTDYLSYGIENDPGHYYINDRGGELLRLCLEKGVSSEEHNLWLAYFLREVHNNVLLRLQEDFKTGRIREPTIENEILPATIKRVEELLAALEAQGATT